MTEAELFALRDVTPTFDTVERSVEGRKVMVPKMRDDVGALFDPFMVADSSGQSWMVGLYNGEQVRRRMAGWSGIKEDETPTETMLRKEIENLLRERGELQDKLATAEAKLTEAKDELSRAWNEVANLERDIEDMRRNP